MWSNEQATSGLWAEAGAMGWLVAAVVALRSVMTLTGKASMLVARLIDDGDG